jgi:hypothetical protein
MIKVGERERIRRAYYREGKSCQPSPDMGPVIFGQDGPLAEMTHGKLPEIKQMKVRTPLTGI